MNRVRQPFNVSGIAQAAAVAALADQEFVQQSRALNQQGMQTLTAGLQATGSVLDSVVSPISSASR